MGEQGTTYIYGRSRFDEWGMYVPYYLRQGGIHGGGGFSNFGGGGGGLKYDWDKGEYTYNGNTVTRYQAMAMMNAVSDPMIYMFLADDKGNYFEWDGVSATTGNIKENQTGLSNLLACLEGGGIDNEIQKINLRESNNPFRDIVNVITKFFDGGEWYQSGLRNEDIFEKKTTINGKWNSLMPIMTGTVFYDDIAVKYSITFNNVPNWRVDLGGQKDEFGKFMTYEIQVYQPSFNKNRSTTSSVVLSLIFDRKDVGLFIRTVNHIKGIKSLW